MVEQSADTAADATSRDAARNGESETPPRGSHFWRRLGVVSLALGLILGGLVSFAPNLIVRHLLASELDRLGIVHQGIESIDIDLTAGRIWLGPVSLRAGDGDPALIGELGVEIKLAALLEHRVLVDRLLLRGVDAQITRGESGLSINGIALDRLLGAADDQDPGRDLVGADEPAWSAGLESVRLLDSKLLFNGLHGSLVANLERLTLLEFNTWQPDRAGRFELLATVNEIDLDWRGEVRPFGNPIEFDVQSRINRAELAKLARFIGPLGLDRGLGSYDTDLRYQLRFFDNGRIEGGAVGEIAIKDADYRKQGEFSARVGQGRLELDLDFVYSETEALTLKGEIASDVKPGHFSINDRTHIDADAAKLVFKNLDVEFDADDLLRVALQPDLDLQGFQFSGPVEISVDSLLDLLARLQALSGAQVSKANTGLGDLAGSEVAVSGSDVKIGRIQFQSERFGLLSKDGEVDLDMVNATDLSGIDMVVYDGSIKAETLASRLTKFKVHSGKGRLQLESVGINAVQGARLESDYGELDLASLATDIQALSLETQTGVVLASINAEAELNGLQGKSFAIADVPEGRVRLGGLKASVTQASADVHGDTVTWRVQGGAELADLSSDFANGVHGKASLAGLRLVDFHADQDLLLKARKADVEALELFVLRSLLEAMDRAVDDESDAGSPVAEAESAATKSKHVSAAPDVRRIQALLAGLGYRPGPADGVAGAKTVAAIKAFQKDAGLTVDGEVTLALQDALLAREARERSAKPITAPAGDVRIQIEEVGLASGSAIRFRDDIVEPQVKVDTIFQELRMTGVDIGPDRQRADLSLRATVNEFTRLDLDGQLDGLGERANLTAKLGLRDMELSNYSPYVVQLAGMYLDSGQLDSQVEAKIEQGALAGEIQLGVDYLAFHPLSAEDAEAVTKTVGVPLDTVVGLLQDNDGRIELTLPVAGTLDQPDIDVSSAVNKALGGVLKKVFPPTLIGSLLSNVGKQGDPGFEPIEFAANSAELSDAGRAYAEDVAEFLVEHPKLALKICGRSTAQDQAAAAAKDPIAVAQALQDLAVARKRAVRGYLINAKSVSPKQIPECRSSFDAKDDGMPRVEIDF